MRLTVGAETPNCRRKSRCVAPRRAAYIKSNRAGVNGLPPKASRPTHSDA